MNMKQQLAIQAIYDARDRGEIAGEPDPLPMSADEPASSENPTRTDVARMGKKRLEKELADRGLSTDGRADELRDRLAGELFE